MKCKRQPKTINGKKSKIRKTKREYENENQKKKKCSQVTQKNSKGKRG